MNHEDIVRALKDGDRRSGWHSNQVVALVRRTLAPVPALIDCMDYEDGLVCTCAADAAEKLTLHHPHWLQPFERRPLKTAACTTQQELQRHLAQMLPRSALSKKEPAMGVRILRHDLKDKSRIVRTCAMQGLADLAW